jgi:hypothetical protein
MLAAALEAQRKQKEAFANQRQAHARAAAVAEDAINAALALQGNSNSISGVNSISAIALAALDVAIASAESVSSDPSFPAIESLRAAVANARRVAAYWSLRLRKTDHTQWTCDELVVAFAAVAHSHGLPVDSIDAVTAYVRTEGVSGSILAVVESEMVAQVTGLARRANLTIILKKLCSPSAVNDPASVIASDDHGADVNAASSSHDSSIAITRLKDVPFSGLSDFNPINGLWRAPELPLLEALTTVPLSVDSEWDLANTKQVNPCHFPLAMCARNALRFARNRLVEAAAAVNAYAEQCADGTPASSSAPAPGPERLNVDEIAAIHLYTQETPFYPTLNALLRSQDRGPLTPYLPYLRLLVTALGKLKPAHATVFRGVNVDLSSQYLTGLECVWWPISSTTSEINVLSNPMFFDLAQPRTLFTIQTKHAVDIRLYSAMSKEAELVLLPGACFEVTGVLQLSAQPKCVMVTMTEADERPMTLANAPAM